MKKYYLVLALFLSGCRWAALPEAQYARCIEVVSQWTSTPEEINALPLPSHIKAEMWAFEQTEKDRNIKNYCGHDPNAFLSLK